MQHRTFWRIVQTNPPTRQDFLSHATLGRRFTDPARAGQAEGISVFATEAQARRQARHYPMLGEWLAELRLGPELDAEIARTDRRPGHHTIWADPDVLLNCVVRTTTVNR